MNKNERPAFLKGKGAAVGAVLCFVAVITMVGSYTYNHYKKDMEQQIKDAQTTAEQLTEDDSTLANTDDILPTDTDSEEDNAENQESQKDVQQENEEWKYIHRGNSKYGIFKYTECVVYSGKYTCLAGKRSNTFEF